MVEIVKPSKNKERGVMTPTPPPKKPKQQQKTFMPYNMVTCVLATEVSIYSTLDKPCSGSLKIKDIPHLTPRPMAREQTWGSPKV